MKFSQGRGGHTQGYTQGGQWWKDISHGQLSLFIVHKFALLGVLDHCVKNQTHALAP